MLCGKRGDLGMTIFGLVLVMPSGYIRLSGIEPCSKNSVDSIQVLVLVHG